MSGTDRAGKLRKEPGEGRGSGKPGSGSGRSRPRTNQSTEPTGVRWASTSTDHRNAGWIIISYLVAGMLIYGGLGWFIGVWIGASSVAMLIGILVGLTLALVLVVLRYGRS